MATGLSTPYGIGPYGLGTPPTAPTPGGLVNRDASGVQQGSVAISLDNASKGQYVFDAYGRRLGSGNVRHMATLALSTVRGSSCVPDLGERFSEIRKIEDSFEKEQAARITEALSSMVERKIITIDAITVDPGQGHPASTRVRLTDLTQNIPIDLVL